MGARKCLNVQAPCKAGGMCLARSKGQRAAFLGTLSFRAAHSVVSVLSRLRTSGRSRSRTRSG